jgi:hypothetical protein
MTQRWLIKPPESEATFTSEIDSSTRAELILLMAAAIESVYLQQVNSLERSGEFSDERTTTASQDHS